MRTVRVLGINFLNDGVLAAVGLLKKGGLMVVPSGPGLESIPVDASYFESLRSADIALPDSGFMALIWNLTHRTRIRRVSGLEFLKVFLADQEVKKSTIFLVDPRPVESEANRRYLISIGFSADAMSSYLAPAYNREKVEDPQLLAEIEARRPRYVLINLGGGIQEKLGWYLRHKLSYTPGIICTGAAIAFLTGHQANIPMWADKMYLGWFVRILNNPSSFGPRYLKAFGLAKLMLRHGSNSPL